MLSVIVDAYASEQELPVLMAALTPAAMDGVVRDVVIAAPATSPMVEAICEETGAEVTHGGFGQAAVMARHDRLLVLPASLRLRAGWIGVLNDHLARGGGDALVIGQGQGGLRDLWRTPPYGLLMERARLSGLAHAQLKALRRRLRAPVTRLG